MSQAFQALGAFIKTDIETMIQEAGGVEPLVHAIRSVLVELSGELDVARKVLAAMQAKVPVEQELADKWQLNAMLAVKAGNDDAARQALGFKNQSLAAVEHLQDQADRQEAAVEVLERAVAVGRAKLQEVERRDLAEPEQPAPTRARSAYDMVMGNGAVLPVYPWLVPPAWGGMATSATRPLLPAPDIPEIPFVALCYLMGDGRMFAGPERLTMLGCTRQQIDAEAVANLSRMAADWDVKEFPGMRMAVFQGDLLAAEHVLDVDFMKRGGGLLGADSGLAVAIPRRGIIMATDIQDREGAARLMTAARTVFSEAGEEGITPLLFLVMHGILIGVVR